MSGKGLEGVDNKKGELVSTANGPVKSRGLGRVQSPLGELDETKDIPYSPNLWCVGRGCKAQGYDFHWKALADRPEITNPEGNPVGVRMQGFVPLLAGCTVGQEQLVSQFQELAEEFFKDTSYQFVKENCSNVACPVLPIAPTQ